MTLKLVKVEEGLSSGAIIFHEFVKKTPEEVKMLRENIEQREALPKQRRAEQEENVHRKELAKQALKRKPNLMNPPTEVEGMEQNDNDDIDDADWYRQEVGEEPDSEFMAGVYRSKDRNSMGFKNKTTKDGKGQGPQAEVESKSFGKKSSLTRKIPSNKHKQNEFGKSTTKTDGDKQGNFRKRKQGVSKEHYGESMADKILSQKRKGAGGAKHFNKRRKTSK